MNNLNVYGGLTAINDFLNPENHLTPLVELPSSLNPFWLTEFIFISKCRPFFL